MTDLRADGEEDPNSPVGDGKVRTPSKRLRWKWADGKYHSEPPPSGQELVVTEPSAPKIEVSLPESHLPAPLTQTESTLPAAERPPSPPARPDVPADFKHTERTMLRQVALDFVLRAAALNMRGHNVIMGVELMKEAEELEKWLANP